MKILIVLFLLSMNIIENKVVKINWNNVKEEPIKLKSFASTIEYVQLQTSDDCLLDSNFFYLTDDYIVAVSPFTAAYLFNRKNGRFIHKIAQNGQGPKDFSQECVFVYGLKNNVLYVNDATCWKGIDIISKEIVETIRKPVFANGGKYNAIRNPWHFNDSIYWGYVNNITGNVDCKLVSFNSDGVVLKEIPNYIIYEHKHQDMPYFWGMFYEYDNQTCFKQYQGNDTVFVLDKNGIYPHIIFEWDKKQLTYQQMPIWTENQIFMSYINENDKYIYFDCQVNGKMVPKEIFYCIYDKRNKIFKSTRNHTKGFIDDIDGLGDFTPVLATDSELIDVITAESWLEWENKGKIMPKNVNVKFDDNPILRIVHLK